MLRTPRPINAALGTQIENKKMYNKLYYIGWAFGGVAAIIFARTDSEDWLRWVALALILIGAALMVKAKKGL